MDTALWVVAVLLAVVFLGGGLTKIFRTREQLDALGMAWVEDFGAGTVKMIGALEVLAAVGLTVPAVLGIVPVLVPLAALGLVLLMVCAAVTHVRRGNEGQMIVANVTLLILAAVVAWGRLGWYAF